MPSHWTQNDLLIDGARLHYYRTGHDNKPSLLLIHGFSDNGLCWTPVARELEAEYDVIMPDMRGHGLSARLQVGEKVDAAADVARLIHALGLTRPLIVGHSMGAMITYQVGLRFSELTRALVLEDPPWWQPQPTPASSSDGLTENVVVTWAKSLANKTFDDLLVEYREQHPNWSEEFIRIMCESKKQLDPAVIDTMNGAVQAQEPTWFTSLQNVTQPMLLIIGNPKLGAIVTPEVTVKVRELNPSIHIVNVPDVGHLIRFDNFAAYMGTLRKFLKKV